MPNSNLPPGWAQGETLAGTGQLTQAAWRKLPPGRVQEEEDGQPMQWLWAGVPVVWQIGMFSVRPPLSGGGKRRGSRPS